MTKLYSSVKFSRPGFPLIHIVPRTNARNITVRRNQVGEIHVSVPYGIDSDKAMESIKRLLTRMMQSPEPEGISYHSGQIITTPDIIFRIESCNTRPNTISVCNTDGVVPRDGHDVTIRVGEAIDYTQPWTIKTISSMMHRVASLRAHLILIQQADSVANRVGVHPSAWEVGRGHKRLGSCDGNRRIILSSILMFLPVELREYVICHELAHLTEMNHSARFHQLCNGYCHGQEKTLEASLRQFKWPILR